MAPSGRYSLHPSNCLSSDCTSTGRIEHITDSAHAASRQPRAPRQSRQSEVWDLTSDGEHPPLSRRNTRAFQDAILLSSGDETPDDRNRNARSPQGGFALPNRNLNEVLSEGKVIIIDSSDEGDAPLQRSANGSNQRNSARQGSNTLPPRSNKTPNSNQRQGGSPNNRDAKKRTVSMSSRSSIPRSISRQESQISSGSAMNSQNTSNKVPNIAEERSVHTGTSALTSRLKAHSSKRGELKAPFQAKTLSLDGPIDATVSDNPKKDSRSRKEASARLPVVSDHFSSRQAKSIQEPDIPGNSGVPALSRLLGTPSSVGKNSTAGCAGGARVTDEESSLRDSIKSRPKVPAQTHYSKQKHTELSDGE
jgi:hypothetical protein